LRAAFEAAPGLATARIVIPLGAAISSRWNGSLVLTHACHSIRNLRRARANLSPAKERRFAEIFRVLKPGGELFFSDVLADRRLPPAVRNDPVLLGPSSATGERARAKPFPFARKPNGQWRSKFYGDVKRRPRIRATPRNLEGATSMKISARNILSGKVIAVAKGATTAHVKIEIAAGAVVTASITNEAVDELGLAVGKKASAVVKASDVMVAID
jgi:molybdopterin-binding protein